MGEPLCGLMLTTAHGYTFGLREEMSRFIDGLMVWLDSQVLERNMTSKPMKRKSEEEMCGYPSLNRQSVNLFVSQMNFHQRAISERMIQISKWTWCLVPWNSVSFSSTFVLIH